MIRYTAAVPIRSRLRFYLSLPLYPRHKEIHDLFLLDLGELSVKRDVIPLIEASAAAAGGGVHGLENGMAVHRGLPAVIYRVGRRELHSHKIGGVPPDGIIPLFGYIGKIRPAQAEAGAEF